MNPALTKAVEAGASALWSVDIDNTVAEELARIVLRAALPVIGAELTETAWLQSKQGATHEQIAEALRAKLAEIMGEV